MTYKIIFAVAVIIGFHSSIIITKSYRATFWTRCDAKVMHSELFAHNYSKGNKATGRKVKYYPKILYYYCFNGIRYTGETITVGQLSSDDVGGNWKVFMEKFSLFSIKFDIC